MLRKLVSLMLCVMMIAPIPIAGASAQTLMESVQAPAVDVATPVPAPPPEPLPESAEEPTMDDQALPRVASTPLTDFSYAIVDSQAKITSYTGNAATVIVPETIEGYPVTSVRLSDCTNDTFNYFITNVELPNTVTTLDTYAFFNYASLTMVTGLENVQRVETAAFNNTKIKELTFTQELTEIAYSAFYLSTIRSITLPDSCIIQDGAFNGMARLKDIILIPGNGTKRLAVADGVLFTADLKKLVLFPASLAYAYTIPDGVTAIGRRAFCGDKDAIIRQVTIPDSVVSIEDTPDNMAVQFITYYVGLGSYADAFFKPSVLAKVYLISPEHPEGVLQEKAVLREGEKMSPDQYAYRIEGDEIAVTGYFGSDTVLKIPAEIEGLPVRNIGLCRDVFADPNTTVQTIILPSSIKALAVDAFRNYSALTSVQGLEYVETVGIYAFASSGITEAVFTPALKEIGRGALDNTPLETVTFPSDVTFVDMEYGFPLRFNLKLREIRLVPGTGAPKYVMLDGAMYTADMRQMVYCPSAGAASLNIPDGVTSIRGEGICIVYYSLLHQIVIPRSVTEIEVVQAIGNTLNSQWLGAQIFVTPGSYADVLFQSYPEFNVTVVDDIDKVGSVEKKADEIIALVIQPGMNEYQKALALHDWIATNTEYDHTLTYRDAYNVFFRGTGVCQGYLEAYQILLTKAGIENRYIVFTGMNHGCNLARLDGKWTYIDVTLDDVEDSAPRYTYFGMTDQMIYDMYGEGVIGGSLAALDPLMNQAYRLGLCDDAIESSRQAINERIANGARQFDIPLPDYTSVGDSYNLHVVSHIVAGALSNRAWMIDGLEYKASVSYRKEAANLNVVMYSASESTPPEGMLFEVVDNEILISGYTGASADLVIPSTILGLPVTGISPLAFQNNKSLVSIHIAEGVTEIGDQAFAYCSSLKSVSLPNSLTVLGSLVFGDCERLQEITLPPHITKIPSGCFYDCLTMTTVRIQGQVTQIGDAAFAQCYKLSSINLPDSVALIDYGAFANCDSLKLSSLPLQLQILGPEALSGVSMDVLNIPAGLTMIGECFMGIFSNNVKSISVDPANTAFTQINGMLLSKDGKRLFLYPSKSTAASCVIPDGVERIAGSAFAGASMLKSVSFPDGLFYAGWYAFYECVLLESVKLPESLLRLPDAMFSGCKSLDNVELPGQLRSVGAFAFKDCISLESIDLPDTVGYIGTWAFTATALRSLRIPLAITRVNDQIALNGSIVKIEAHPWVTSLSPAIFAKGTTPVVRGYAGTYAEQFAKSNGFIFEEITGSLPPAPGYLEDPTEDGFWDQEDILMLTAIILGLDQQITEEQKAKADMNSDGDVDVGDLVWMENQNDAQQ